MCNLISQDSYGWLDTSLMIHLFSANINKGLWPSWRGKRRCSRWAVGFTTCLPLAKEIFMLFLSLIASASVDEKKRLHNISEKACQLFWLTRVTQILKHHATRKLRIGHKTQNTRKGFSYVRWKPWNVQLAKMRSFHQSKRSGNKQYAVEVRWDIFIENLTYGLFLRAVVNIPI